MKPIKNMMIYDYTKNELFNTALELSTVIYQHYNGKLDLKDFNDLTYTSCKIHINLVHAFCSSTDKTKIYYYKTASLATTRLYERLESIEPIPLFIQNLFNTMKPHFFRIYNYRPIQKGGVPNEEN